MVASIIDFPYWPRGERSAVQKGRTETTSKGATVQNPLDPFGIFEACSRVQNAWLAHPRELSEQLSKLCSESWALQTWQRMVGGFEHDDLIPPVRYDERFQDPVWTENPFLDTIKEFYLLYTHWLEDAIFETPDVPDSTRRRAAFWVRELLNAAAPTNFFWTNPVALKRCIETGGVSVLKGWNNFLADAAKGTVSMVDKREFEVGRNLATTPGEVVLRNELLELIQYTPSTDTVHAIPMVIVAPWINKYYILDLNQRKSLVRYLVDQGFTVFVTSWKNPGADMRATTWDDYMLSGVLQAVNVAREICQAPHVHLTGYCIGGTIVATLLAWLNHKNNSESPVAHSTLLTTLVEFSRPGDIDVFVDEQSLAFIDKLMDHSGYLDGDLMAASFRVLRSNSLIWHYWVHNYLYGESPPVFDVLYWNMDCTRMPQVMHSYYLREFYWNNKLVQQDALRLGDRPIDLRRISQPLYVVGAEQDHIAPWASTFKLCELTQSPVRYVLATSGHIMGIISPPVVPPKRRYWAGDVDGHTDPEAWRSGTDKVPGSWWTDWIEWLRPQCGERVPPPSLGNEQYPCLAAAPGAYVLER